MKPQDPPTLDTDDVSAALHLLGDSLEAEVQRINTEGSQAKPHESNAKQIRWRNTAQWARNKMVNEDGRMQKTSQRGIWEFSPHSSAWFKEKPVTPKDETWLP